jgi:L-malate glycosyltransferase
MSARADGAKRSLLITNFHSGDSGGHKTYIRALVDGLRMRWECCVACPATSDLWQRLSGTPGVRLIDEPFPSKARDLASVVRAIGRFRRLLGALQPDIVHVNGSPDHRLVMYATALAGSRPRIVLTKHNTLPIKAGLSRSVRARCFTDHLIAVGPSAEAIIAGSPYRTRPRAVIPNGIDLGRFAPASPGQRERCRARFAVPADRIALVSVAGTASYKGWSSLARALLDAPDALRKRFAVLLAGAPVPVEVMRRECGTLLDEGVIRFVGVLDDVRELIHAGDAGFVLSHAVETISFACREMMGCGLPVLVSDYGDLPHNVADGVEGWVVPSRDPGPLQSLLGRIAMGEFDLPGMGGRARARAQREFGIDHMLAATEAVYRSVLERRPA